MTPAPVAQWTERLTSDQRKTKNSTPIYRDFYAYMRFFPIYRRVDFLTVGITVGISNNSC